MIKRSASTPGPARSRAKLNIGARSVEAHIENARGFNPQLKAIAADRFDFRAERGKKPQTGGISYAKAGVTTCHRSWASQGATIKESFVSRHAERGRLVHGRRHRAEADAHAGARLRAARRDPDRRDTTRSRGDEWIESNTRLYGRTKPAYDPLRNAGG